MENQEVGKLADKQKGKVGHQQKPLESGVVIFIGFCRGALVEQAFPPIGFWTKVVCGKRRGGGWKYMGEPELSL